MEFHIKVVLLSFAIFSISLTKSSLICNKYNTRLNNYTNIKKIKSWSNRKR